MADLDSDGQLDLVSGSYWPGDLSLFRGLGGGKFAPGVFLQDKGGGNLNAGPKWKSDQEPEMDSLAASPALVDWEADGDLDLLVGNIAGRVILILNEGTAQVPVFGTKRTVQDHSSDIHVEGDAGPETADWDGDGLWDLLVGAGNGEVRYYKNVGILQAPSFASGVPLIAGMEWEAATVAIGQSPARSGLRAKVSVTDWNRDGRPDLLVGDFSSQKNPEPVLTPDQIAERDQLRARRDALIGRQPAEGDEVAQQAWSDEYTKLREALDKLEAGQSMHGFVWVYLRQAAVTAAPASAAR